MANKKYFVVIDTETCNTVEQPLPYDIGWAICDRYGNIEVERSFVVAETFLDMKDVMKSAYYAEKIPQYWDNIKNGLTIIKPMWAIRKQLLADMKEYNTKRVCAYNMGFDKRALNNLMRYHSKSWCRWFFPFGTEFYDIWNLACSTLLNTKSYIDFALKNGLVSDCDNIQTSAECAYKFITKNCEFEEEHKGLDDVRIEVAVMASCYRTHKKIENSINSACWRKVQRKRKEMELRQVFA
jgi:hypothetical protein